MLCMYCVPGNSQPKWSTRSFLHTYRASKCVRTYCIREIQFSRKISRLHQHEMQSGERESESKYDEKNEQNLTFFSCSFGCSLRFFLPPRSLCQLLIIIISSAMWMILSTGNWIKSKDMHKWCFLQLCVCWAATAATKKRREEKTKRKKQTNKQNIKEKNITKVFDNPGHLKGIR